jgi:hypothetical protein
MARTLTKEKPVKQAFMDGIWDAVVNSEPNKDYNEQWWIEKPVTAQEFCTTWIKESLYPEQENFVNAMVGEKCDEFELRYDEGHGFWGKGCFGGKEKISLLNGEEKTFEKLVKEYPDGKYFYVYSVDVNNKIVPGKAHSPRVTKKVKQILELTLDSSEKIKSTINHLYMLRSGKYKKACKLKSGDCLMTNKLFDKKVKSVKIINLNEPIPVYDITVEKYHNFALSSGVFVHNSGKDRTISKMQAYVVYKLMCLKNPQKFLRENYGCSIGDGDAIDLANMSINARQAQNVYFKKFKQLVKAVKNPKTGKNWFSEKGVDLRDGYDVQNTEVRFGHSITAHSLNSETNTGEGLNIFLATIDEFGSFAFDKAFELLDAIRDTVVSRFPKVGKVCVISYKYYNNDPMHVLYQKEKENPRVFSSLKATFEVNLQMTKEKLSEQYKRNPEKSKMTYECLGGESVGGYVGKKYMISKMFTPEYENPIVGDLISVDGSLLPTLKFKDWFKSSSGRLYALHIDMATGKKTEGNDCAGLALVHIDKMFPRFDEKLKKDLYSEGMIIDFVDNDPELLVVRKGIIVDLTLQITAKPKTEIQFSDVRKFIMRLKEQFDFNIVYVTYDGWESRDSIQILNQAGMHAEKFSVDKTNEAYDTWKELMYQQLVKTYPNPIAEREAKELQVNTVGKVDHPVESWDRFILEGTNKGSKDVMDAIVGAGKTAYDKFSLESDVFFG